MLSSKIVRNKTIKLSCNSGAGHLASSLSCVEILTVLFRDFLKYKVNQPTWEGRDRFILSKGHGTYSYYVILNLLGILPDDEIRNFYNGSKIKGCLTKNDKYMIEASTGSLGHGLPIAVGMAKALKMQNMSNKVVCIVGDGEMQEGSNFEALAFAYRYKLDNLLLIIDANDLQAMSKVDDVGLDNDRLSQVLSQYVPKKNYFDIDGHDEASLYQSFEKFFTQKNESYSICFCRTIKGKGIEMMEHSIKYHFRCPTEDGYVVENDE